MSAEAISYNDSFSFQRVGELFSYYRATVSRQMLIYFVASVFFSILLLIPGSDTMRVGFFSLSWMIMQWMAYLSPLSMAGKGKSGLADRLLPVKASERLTFYILYFIIILPVILCALPLCTEMWIYDSLGDSDAEFKMIIGFQLNSSWIMKAINITGGVCCCLVCLLTILRARHNRMLFGILSAVGVQVALGIIGAIYSGYEMAASGLPSKAFRQGLEDGMAGKPAMPPEELSEMTLKYVSDLIHPSPATFVVLGIIAACLIVILAFLYRTLRKPSH